MILKALVCLAALFALWIFSLWLFQRSMQYFPDSAAPEGLPPEYREVSAQTDDGLSLKAWHAPARGDNPTILLFHGNGGSGWWRAPDFMPLVEAGYGVLLAEYRGYGGNPGKPSEPGFYNDGEAWLAFLNLPPHKIVLYGESLGSGIAVEMAARHPDLRAIILENAYTSFADLASVHYSYIPFVERLVRDRYDTASKIAGLQMPKLFLIAGNDVLVPPAMGRTLYGLTQDPKTLKIYPAGHNDIRTHGVMHDVLLFIETQS